MIKFMSCTDGPQATALIDIIYDLIKIVIMANLLQFSRDQHAAACTMDFEYLWLMTDLG